MADTVDGRSTLKILISASLVFYRYDEFGYTYREV